MIGFFGGTFDPIHFGHLQPALEVIEQLELSTLHLLPCHVPSHRQKPQVTAQQRAHMVRLAIRSEPSLCLDERELLRQNPSYTVETLEAIRSEVGLSQSIVFVMGMDAFLLLPHWHRWQALFALAHIVVVCRPGSDKRIPPWAEIRLQQEARYLHQRAAGYVMVCEVTALAISATMIRDKIAIGSSVRYLLPEAVWQYIDEQGFYRN